MSNQQWNIQIKVFLHFWSFYFVLLIGYWLQSEVEFMEKSFTCFMTNSHRILILKCSEKLWVHRKMLFVRLLCFCFYSPQWNDVIWQNERLAALIKGSRWWMKCWCNGWSCATNLIYESLRWVMYEMQSVPSFDAHLDYCIV